jgi:hypothetical protein
MQGNTHFKNKIKTFNALANTINWTVFDDAFEQHYSQDNGSPSKPNRLMVDLLLLKQLQNLSGGRVVSKVKRYPCFQCQKVG